MLINRFESSNDFCSKLCKRKQIVFSEWPLAKEKKVFPNFAVKFGCSRSFAANDIFDQKFQNRRRAFELPKHEAINQYLRIFQQNSFSHFGIKIKDFHYPFVSRNRCFAATATSNGDCLQKFCGNAKRRTVVFASTQLQ